ncbi:hypothetical protein QR680_013321 [Steinernema hermaphroditum]|uniref:BZIP domain-containing protein n=1 Tax=Steinernema hermaphroditum TaxID=289476 RepID=A0AA39I6H7_9BILA|nr:hypothetical protein QR680_013321 [Steinernema hermaphroditum]
MSVATSTSVASAERKEDSSVDVVSLETPQVLGAGLSPSVLNAAIGSTAGFPTTPELKKYLTMNPFEIKFREANRRISQSSQELLEQNGLVPPTIAISSGGVLKLPSSFSQSPGLFPSINMLSADIDPTEALKTADIAKLVQQMKESGSSLFPGRLSTDEGNQTPRTADVLNAVLDMHSDRLGSINYLGVSSAATVSAAAAAAAVAAVHTVAGVTAASAITPPASVPTLIHPVASSSIPKAPSPVAPIKAGELTVAGVQVPALAVVSTSSTITTMYPPLSLNTLPHSTVANGGLLQPTAIDPTGNSPRSPINMTQLKTAKPIDSSVIPINASGSQFVGNDAVVNHWSSSEHDVKPVIHKRSVESLHSPYYHSDYEALKSKDDASGRSNDSQVSTTRGRGRGRGASITADMPADERRLTILERNKAAAVRYRKRKKEEHDEMLGRVHGLEQDKVSLTTQNTVLRRELERVTALLKARDSRCVCRANQIMCEGLRSEDSPIDIVSNLDLTSVNVAAGPASLYLTPQQAYKPK